MSADGFAQSLRTKLREERKALTTKKSVANKKSEPTLKLGWWVAVTLRPGTAPLPCYVGQIQAIDPKGLRLTLVDWVTGQPTGWDLFVPYSNLESALVATEKHDLKQFGDAAGKWQQSMCEPG
jgi:hypothetical protein